MAAPPAKDDLEAVADAGKHGGADLERAESGLKHGECVETARVVDRAAERRLAFKFDVRVLPVLAVMCTSCAAAAAESLCVC